MAEKERVRQPSSEAKADRSKGEQFRQMNQNERLASLRFNAAAKVLAVCNGRIDQVYGRGTKAAEQARRMALDVVARHVERGTPLRAPKVRSEVVHELQRDAATNQERDRTR